MTEQYIVWALIVGLVLGAAFYWFAFGRLPRRSEDVSVAERMAEAAWISEAINQRGGYAPPDLVDEVLELHADYLVGPALEADDATTPADDEVEARASRPEGAPRGS